MHRTHSRRLSGLLLLFLMLLVALAVWTAVDDLYQQMYQIQLKLLALRGITG